MHLFTNATLQVEGDRATATTTDGREFKGIAMDVDQSWTEAIYNGLFYTGITHEDRPIWANRRDLDQGDLSGLSATELYGQDFFRLLYADDGELNPRIKGIIQSQSDPQSRKNDGFNILVTPESANTRTNDENEVTPVGCFSIPIPSISQEEIAADEYTNAEEALLAGFEVCIEAIEAQREWRRGHADFIARFNPVTNKVALNYSTDPGDKNWRDCTTAEFLHRFVWEEIKGSGSSEVADDDQIWCLDANLMKDLSEPGKLVIISPDLN